MAKILTTTTDADPYITQAITQWYPDLAEAKPTFNVLFAESTNDKPALAVKGYPVKAQIKVNSYEARVKGEADVTITIAKESWDNMADEEKLSLIDHELAHLAVKRTKKNAIKRDDINRPKMGTVCHDVEIGVFTVVIERHRENSHEAKALASSAKLVQGMFKWM